MKKMQLLFCLLLLVLLVAACAGSEEIPDNEPKMDGMEEKEVAIDYCDLPAGTRVIWFDLSTFIFIPESSYQMGYDELAGEFDFEPAHPVDLDAFWMHETEVTNRQYANCVTAGQCAPTEQYADIPYWFEKVEDLDDPVVGVSWEQADAYCEWIGTRLPTEAEWELTARGVDNDSYPWGADSPDCDRANFLGCLDPEDPQPDLAGLRLEGASPFEMLDMAGNVNEWVSDWYAEDYYQNSPSSSPTGPDSGELRVWRGGDYQSPAEELLSYLRGAEKPDEAQPDLGFRCAWSCGEDVPPQLCQYPSAIETSRPPIERQPPDPDPKLKLVGYCEWIRGSQSTGVVISGAEGTDLDQYDFGSPDGPINCDPVEGGKYVCYGAAIQPDSNVTITICPSCETGYYFDRDAGFCRQYLQIDPEAFEKLDPDDKKEVEALLEEVKFPGEDEPCPPGYYKTNYCGCIPEGTVCEVTQEVGEKEVEQTVEDGTVEQEVGEEPLEGSGGGSFPVDSFFDVFVDLLPEKGQLGRDPNTGAFPVFPKFPVPEDEDCVNNGLLRRCPPNTFSMTDVNGCQVCWPLQTMPDCPEGYFFDEEVNCCIPETASPDCPRWTRYEQLTRLCVPVVFKQRSCYDVSVYVPPCGQRPTVVPVCKNPGQYSDQTSCEAADCKWEYAVHPSRGDCVLP